MSKKKKSHNYSSISLPKSFIDEIDKYIKENPHLGYVGPADFVRDLIRHELRKIKEEKRQ